MYGKKKSVTQHFSVKSLRLLLNFFLLKVCLSFLKKEKTKNKKQITIKKWLAISFRKRILFLRFIYFSKLKDWFFFYIIFFFLFNEL